MVIPDSYIIDPDLRFDNTGEVTSINEENKVIHYSTPCTLGGMIHSGIFMSDNPYKIIGEIDPSSDHLPDGTELGDIIPNTILIKKI